MGEACLGIDRRICMGKSRDSLRRHEGRLDILYWEGTVLLDPWWDAQRSPAAQYVKHIIVSDSVFGGEGHCLLNDLFQNPRVSRQRPGVQQSNVLGSAMMTASDPF